MALEADVAKLIRGGRLLAILDDATREGIETAHNIAQDAVGGNSTFDPDDPEVRRMLKDSGDRITGIVEKTRRRVARYVEEGVREGMSIQEIAGLIRQDKSGAFAPWRAKLIARTESGTTINGGSIIGYRRSGLVEGVEVLDGGDCDWPTGHGNGTANGRIVSLTEAQKHLIAHPACVRAFSPILRSEAR